MAEGGYVDTFLLDANRQSSEEMKGDNQTQASVYTNRIGEGIKLNSGDKVSVHSGYISKRGAGADTIELQGKTSGKKITLKKLTKTQYQKNINAPSYYGINVPNNNYSQLTQEYGCEQYTTEDVSYDIKDNEANFNISYYKTANGEGYYHLPRRYDAWKDTFQTQTDEGPGRHANSSLALWPFLFAPFDKAKAAAAAHGGWVNGAGLPLLQDCYKNGLQQSADYPYGRPSTVLSLNYYKFCYSNRLRRCMADIYFYQEGSVNVAGDGGDTTQSAQVVDRELLSMVWKKKNDGSRYTIYVKEISYFSKRNPKKWFLPDVSKVGQTTLGDDETTDNRTASRHDYQDRGTDAPIAIYQENRDPAQSEYIKYTETKSISLEPGNYSPANIASELTNQLNLTEEQKYITAVVQAGDWPFGASVPPMTPGVRQGLGTPGTDQINNVENDTWDHQQQIGKQVIISTITDSTCYKALNCANSVSVEPASYDTYAAHDGTGNSVIEGNNTFSYDGAESTVNYGSAYQFIGVKRPELFEAGRKIAKELGYRKIGANPDGTRVGAFNWATQKPYTADANSVPHSAAGVHHDEWSWKQLINPYISEEVGAGDINIAIIKTSWNWNEDNLKALKEFFEVQGKYPELFEGVQFHSGVKDPPKEQATDNITYKDGLTNHNSRFLHCAQMDGAFGNATNWSNRLGTDFMWAQDQADVEAPGACGSNALFFYYDEARKDNASGGDTDNNLYYGLFVKKTFNNPYSGVIEDCIAITTEKIGGISWIHFDGYSEAGGVPTGGYMSRGLARTIGFDVHFSAYGTSCINLYDGHLSGSVQDITSDSTAPTTQQSVPIAVQPVTSSGIRSGSGDAYPVFQYLNKRYIGAENPQLSFDTRSSKFNFQDLHTPERVGNVINSGAKADLPIVAETNDKVYFVNKRLLMKEYCPDMFPYAQLVASKVTTTHGSGATETQNGNPANTTYTTYMNQNITPWSIMDADGGIFLEDFGFDNNQLLSSEYPTNTLKATDWKHTLWNMLGFTYDQFHTTFDNQDLSRQTRINNTITTDTIGKPTTNADVEPADLGQYNTNIWGAQLRTNQIPAIYAEYWYDPNGGGSARTNKVNGYFPSATIIQQSAQINAATLPTKMRDPYYLISTDIIADTKYIGSDGGNQKLPVIAVVNKSSGAGDFFFGDGQTEFTITAPKTITGITTQILNPDGSNAKLSDDTSIIYKITKVNNASLDVIAEMTQPKKK